jgi:hypothetical protein
VANDKHSIFDERIYANVIAGFKKNLNISYKEETVRAVQSLSA